MFSYVDYPNNSRNSTLEVHTNISWILRLKQYFYYCGGGREENKGKEDRFNVYYVCILTSFEYILCEHLINLCNLNWFFNIIRHANLFRLVFI